MQKTRLISAILALTVALCVALSGCVGGGDNSSGASGGGKKNEDANEYYVSKLEMVTPPDRTEYVEGEEAFDPDRHGHQSHLERRLRRRKRFVQ